MLNENELTVKYFILAVLYNRFIVNEQFIQFFQQWITSSLKALNLT